MKIYSMVATFGKLEHATLTLHDGLNVIEAPNEWGKSTWCAFLVAMFYGVETRAKTTKNALADKEHYLPWSGSSMSGRIDLNWNERDITIERRTKGRVPMGQFSAYETRSGIAVAELDAQNCGGKLLGVERSVFLRSSFVRLADLPVAQDEALRKRLNALVTTGDESGDAERLATQLHDLKNKCRHNRTGALPQAQSALDALDAKIRELNTLEDQVDTLKKRVRAISDDISALENHQKHLAYTDAQADAERVAIAQTAMQDAQARAEALRAECAELHARADAEAKLTALRACNAEGMALQEQRNELNRARSGSVTPEPFLGKSPDEACEMARADTARYEACKPRKITTVLGVLALVIGVLGGIFVPLLWVLACIGVVLLITTYLENANRERERTALSKKYGDLAPDRWCICAEAWAQSERAEQLLLAEERRKRTELDAKLNDWRMRKQTLTQGASIADAEQECTDIIALWDASEKADLEEKRAREHLQVVSSMARSAQKPQEADTLSLSAQETEASLRRARAELSDHRSRLHQYEGRMEALGDRERMLSEHEKLCDRIAKLTRMEQALVIAEQTLADATIALQRRFAPQIAEHAQKLMNAFSLGRYARLSLSEDMGLRSATGEEDTLHDPLWRSDGTADQLYLALRLAVAQALAPDAPLVLDDALVRFDDARLCATLRVLRTLAENDQIILFTCQAREKAILAEITKEETI